MNNTLRRVMQGKMRDLIQEYGAEQNKTKHYKTITQRKYIWLVEVIINNTTDV